MHRNVYRAVLLILLATTVVVAVGVLNRWRGASEPVLTGTEKTMRGISDVRRAPSISTDDLIAELLRLAHECSGDPLIPEGTVTNLVALCNPNIGCADIALAMQNMNRSHSVLRMGDGIMLTDWRRVAPRSAIGVGESPIVTSVTKAVVKGFLYQRSDKGWVMRFGDGPRIADDEDLDGFHYLKKLIDKKAEGVQSFLSLRSIRAPALVGRPQESVTDDYNLSKKYSIREKELRTKSDNEALTMDERKELKKCKRVLKDLVDKFGKPRKLKRDNDRNCVCQAIEKAYLRILVSDAHLVLHLMNGIKMPQGGLVYRPSESVEWCGEDGDEARGE